MTRKHSFYNVPFSNIPFHNIIYIFLRPVSCHNYMIRRNLPDLMENPTVVAIAQRLRKTPAQVLLKWILERGVAAIPKSTNAGRLRQNLDLYDFQLTAEDHTQLRALDAGIRVCDFGFFKGCVGNWVHKN